MRTQIRSPLRLFVILLLVGCIVAAGLWILDYISVYSPDGELTYIGISPDRPPPNEKELDEAMGIVREAGWIGAIAGDQEWTLLDRGWGYQPRWISIPNANKLGIRFTAIWEQPVESDGPWYIAKCKWTRLRKGFTTFSNIRTVQVVVDMDRRLPLTLSVAAPFSGSEEGWNPKPIGIPHGKETKVITDAITGEVLYEGHYKGIPRRLKKCPPDLDGSSRH